MLSTPASSIATRSIPMPRPASRRHAVLERPQVILVDGAAFGVAGLLGGLLVLEAHALLDRVVELGVPVGQLARSRRTARTAR